MKEELKIFFTALMFYTRIPCPKNIDHSPTYINKATRYFPLIGWIVGIISFLTFWVSSRMFDPNTAALLSILAGVLVTGAFHEDGLADVADGFGGGWTKAKILEIMKDSRIGAFGVIGLIFTQLIKYLSLSNIFLTTNKENYQLIALIFVSYHSLARLTAINIVFTSQYVRENENSKAKPVAKEYKSKEILFAYFFGVAPLFALSSINWQFMLVIIPLIFLNFYSRYYLKKWIDGYTGDCLGAVEQLGECVCLLTYVAIWKYM